MAVHLGWNDSIRFGFAKAAAFGKMCNMQQHVKKLSKAQTIQVNEIERNNKSSPTSELFLQIYTCHASFKKDDSISISMHEA